MDGLSTYFQMGGYAAFVWPAYGLGLLGLVGIMWLSVKSWKAREDEFNRLKSSQGDGARS
jgi:heme exporter protein D